MAEDLSPLARPEDGFLGKLVAFSLENKLVVGLLLIAIIIWGVMCAPFDWDIGGLPRTPVPVDAIPDIGENQQIVFTKWQGRSPEDIEDQVTYPLASALLGVPGIKTIRSLSMFGFSSIFVIFDENIDFYWSRTRVLEKLSSLPPGTLPPGISPTLGPDATPLGQVYWYTLEGRDPQGNPVGGWDPQELRSIQDWQVRYELLAVAGVSEVASVGGFVREYQVELDPDLMRQYNVTIMQVANAVRKSNLDVGARTMEINRVEYVIRGLGFVKKVSDIAQAVVKVNENIPIRVKDVARVVQGPALRRGALDKGGSEACGGVVVVRYGANPLAVLKRLKIKISQFAPTLPSKMIKVTRPDGTVENVLSQVTIVPFYDRSGLIYETLGTLDQALTEEIMVTIIVVVVLLMHLRSSLLIAGLLPLAVLMCFIAMNGFGLKGYFPNLGVDANVVALSGIAIAIGTMVDMGVVLNENILRQLEEAGDREPSIRVIYRASIEVGSAVMTAVTTTVVSFLPVFTMQAAEGKLFRPLAFTKTFALMSSLIVALVLIPPLAHMLFPRKFFKLLWVPEKYRKLLVRIVNGSVVAVVTVILAGHWLPLGIDKGIYRNLLFAGGLIGGLLFLIHLFQNIYPRILRWCLVHKITFLALPTILFFIGTSSWLGADKIFGFFPAIMVKLGVEKKTVNAWGPWAWMQKEFPGIGKEFMPDLDEGAFLYMPTTTPHASIGEGMDVLSKQDMMITAIPEIDSAVGKLGRADTSLDPAPISMIETIINYKSKYINGKSGSPLRFKAELHGKDFFRNRKGELVKATDGKPYMIMKKFIRDKDGKLIPDANGSPFRLWRPALDPALNPGRKAWAGIRSPNDIWDEIVAAGRIPGTTSAPKLQPIAARIVMLASGMRAPMGLKLYGKGKVTLKQMERVGIKIEKLLKEVPSIKAEAVNAERIVGKPYVELPLDREAISRYGLNIEDVQNVIQTAIGGMPVSTTIEGRERYDILVRYKRELRDNIEELERVIVPGADGQQIPMKELLLGRSISYRRGPQVIKSEDGALVTYVLFDKRPGFAEVDVVEDADRYLRKKLASKELVFPDGLSYKFAGSYENQIRSEKRLMMVLPLALFVIFLILYFQFRSILTSGLVFTGVFVAWSGGFLMLWLYSQGWFANFSVMGVNMRELFQMHTVNLSVAVWVGFLALFGISTDDGVILATYLKQHFDRETPTSLAGIRTATLHAGSRRIRPCLMTVATTILALIPVLTSAGRGADIMVPMAIPSFGGMTVVLLTVFVVPTLYSMIREFLFHSGWDENKLAAVLAGMMAVGAVIGFQAAKFVELPQGNFFGGAVGLVWGFLIGVICINFYCLRCERALEAEEKVVKS